MKKCEYLTVKDLENEPSPLEKVKFEYPPLVKVFNKGVDKDGQKEGLFKG